MTKQEIKDKAVEMHRATVADFQKLLGVYTTESDIDENETKDPEDYSHQDEATLMRRNTEVQLNQAKAELDTLLELDVSPKDSVVLGALVKTDKANFFVSVSTDAIEDGGMKVYGVSTEAPIYRAMQGKKKGDKFQVGDLEYEILEVA